MTYATQAALVGRRPLAVVEIDLSSCGLTYGVSPCTASGGAGSECYNTRGTCQDAANYDSGASPATIKTYRFVESRVDLPHGESWQPCLQSISTTPQEITPGKGIGKRQSVTITLQDFPHHDRGIDPYVANRSYTPEAQGTFFRKLIARNQYYVGRALRVKIGFIGDTFSWSDFTAHNYIIDRIEGPDRNGRVQIVAKDVLKLADDKKAKAPAVSSGVLSAAISAAATSLTLDSGSGADYGTSGYVRIGSEIIQFTGRSTDTLTGLTRGAWGTTAATHSTDDLVQLCLAYSEANVRDIIDDLLVTYAGVSAAYIPDTDWDDERDVWLLSLNLTTIISKPEGVTKLLDELCEQCMLGIWWDDANQEIKLKAHMPARGTDTITALTQDNVVADSVDVKHLQEDRLSQVWCYYAPIDWSADLGKAENFSHLYIAGDTDAEGDDQYGESVVKQVYSRWIPSEGIAAAFATRTLNRYRDYAKQITLALDAAAANSLAVGDLIDVTLDQVVDTDGSAKTVRMQLLRESETDPGHRWEYKALESTYTKRYGFIAPNSTADYTSATEAQKNRYAWIASSADQKMSDDSEPYRII